MNTPRATWHPTAVLVLVSLWLATVGNVPFWWALYKLPEVSGFQGLVTAGALALMLWALLVWFLGFLLWPRWLKAGLMLMLAITTGSSYFMLTYGVVMDPAMLVNAAQTDWREVRDLLSPHMLLAAGLGVFLPGLWLWRQPVRPVRVRALLALQLALACVAFALAAALLWANFQSVAAITRTHTQLRYTINPFNVVYGLVDRLVGESTRASQPLQAVATDAHWRGTATTPDQAPLVVLVLGETARAANFGLGGYARNTTPALAQIKTQGNLAYFSNVKSCGTSTQASVPCMFSHLGKADFEAQNQNLESLMDVLHRAGLAVLWLDNQSGCKGVCDRVPSMFTTALAVPKLCEGGECFDEIMLHELPKQLALLDPARRAKGTVVVMHQMGNHGPAYFKRSPANQKPFQPECTTNALQSCASQHIINAYDNAIAYTDYFVAKTVKWLDSQHRPTALLYVSDHGESLGENGLYLHGMPYSVAPQVQTHVPMLVWLSQPMQRLRGWSMDCLHSQSTRPLSHDHYFSSVLNLAHVGTQTAKPDLDIFAGCGPAPASRL